MQNHAQDAKGRGRPPKQRGNKLLTREMLVHVGTEVLTEKGYSAVGVDEILQRTGISRCSFYYYFKTKEGFGAELIDRYRLSITQKLERCLSDTSLSPLGSLRAFVGEVRTRWRPAECRARPAWPESWREVNTLPENFREQLSAVFAEWQDVFARGLKRAQETGEISPNWTAPLRRPSSGTVEALQRANLELNIKPVDIFIGNFFSRLTG